MPMSMAIRCRSSPPIGPDMGNGAGYVRNREMHSYISTHADRGVIAFWDGSSKGTAQSFALAREFDNPLRVIRIDSCRSFSDP